MKYFFLLLAAGFFISGCSGFEKIYYDIPVGLRSPESTQKFINDYSPYLSGRKFFLDPGHGGSDRKNKGYQGLAVEADVNLHVALYLRDFLQKAGADVIMSRVTDQTVDLKERSRLANTSNADIFLSIHHNASADTSDDYTNYTSTYYHAHESDYAFEPCQRDLARYVERDLAYAMRNSGGPGSFDGTYSDYSIYPGEGFSVLRETKIPSILVECGFHTHHLEEKLLTIDEFNKIEAWGIFRGLCRYFKAGIPEIIPMADTSFFVNKESTLNYILRDSSGIDPNSVSVQFDSVKTLNYTFNAETNILGINLSGLKSGIHEIRINAANTNGNFNFPFRKKITLVQ
ncbi:MAG TPA: N-acetylmuramoyl-L-alanine amidase [Ignavibacteriaceae bacterium]|nr:N-acetylmuramoyl-L-alanine amidase [Ignavibacteriaceae bacterium]